MTGSILVTGSSRGIGKAIALALAAKQYELVVHCRAQRDQAEAVVEQIVTSGGKARILQFDIADRAATKLVLENDIAAHGAYYGAVCNAGITSDASFPAMSGEAWDSVIHTNLDSFYNVLNPLIMPMVKRRAPGRIITLASVSGLMGNRGQTNYSAAKAGIMAATKSLAIELAKREITVNCVAPGLIETEMLAGAEVDINGLCQQIPAQRLGKPEEVAALVCFLMSAEASYITRQVISVNGGLC